MFMDATIEGKIRRVRVSTRATLFETEKLSDSEIGEEQERRLLHAFEMIVSRILERIHSNFTNYILNELID